MNSACTSGDGLDHVGSVLTFASRDGEHGVNKVAIWKYEGLRVKGTVEEITGRLIDFGLTSTTVRRSKTLIVERGPSCQYQNNGIPRSADIPIEQTCVRVESMTLW